MTARILVLEFPGTTCAEETARAFGLLDAPARILREVPRGTGPIVLPGGFAYADWPVPGRAAAATPVFSDVRRAARRGVPILGICNGFQILVAAGLLPGRIRGNSSGRFRCGWERFTFRGARVRLPVAAGFARIDSGDGAEVLLRDGPRLGGLAAGRIWGVMPHPERAVEEAQGGTDGRAILAAFLAQ